jgi:hypothetical protein
MLGRPTSPGVAINKWNKTATADKVKFIEKGEGTMDPRLDSKNFRSGIVMQEFQATLRKVEHVMFAAFAAGVKICQPGVRDYPLGVFILSQLLNRSLTLCRLL